jgi:hypothetical protein
VVLVAIMLFASVEAAGFLGFAGLSDLITEFLAFAGHIFVGLVIFALGLYLANLAGSALQANQAARASMLAMAARVAIIVLAGAMALRQMGLANEIINLAFGLTLGAIAVAVAIAFGIGGRDLAAQQLRSWMSASESKDTQA